MANLQFEDFFVKSIANLKAREAAVSRIVDTDMAQATDYQRKFKKFEEGYFEEYMRIASASD